MRTLRCTFIERVDMDKSYPDCIKTLPRVIIPLKGVTGWVVQGLTSQVVFFEIDAGTTIPPHSHCEQFGVVIEGEMALTIDGQTNIYRRGDSYHIPAGVTHCAEFRTRVRAFDFFTEPHRYATTNT